MWVHGALSVQYGGLDCWMRCAENVDERAYYFFFCWNIGEERGSKDLCICYFIR